MKGINKSYIISYLIALSMIIFAIRGKVGSIFISIFIIVSLVLKIKDGSLKITIKSFSDLKEKILEMNTGNLLAIFLVVFTLLIGGFRNKSFEYYLFIGYLAAVFVLFNDNPKTYHYLWDFLGVIALFEAAGIFIQWLFPSVYYSIISSVLPQSVVMSIKKRLTKGYFTGFTREVSYTMFFIVLGLGTYIFNPNKIKEEDTREKVIRFIKIAFLSVALLISGKKGTVFFFLFALFIIQYLNSEIEHKFIKYLSGVVALLIVVLLTFPIWSKVPSLERFVQLTKFINTQDSIGITNGRIYIYQDAIHLWETNPLFGIGWGNFKYSITGNTWYSGFDVHNCYIQILCENGILGAISFYALTVVSVIQLVKSIKLTKKGDASTHRLAMLSGFIQLFFISFSLTEPILYEYPDYMIYFIAINITCLIIDNSTSIKRIDSKG